MSMQIHELGLLFEEVQMQNILGDGKTFPDCTPKRPLEEIQKSFNTEKDSAGFDLKKFVDANFTLPKAYSTGYKSDKSRTAKQHVETLWDLLTRKPDEAGGSLIPLPHPYIVPGGRFREIYYWDSYFTMLGLRVSGRVDLIQNMVDNFAYLIDKVGYIPNGNRTYFVGRSQPPFFSLMVKLLSDLTKTADAEEVDSLAKYLPAMEREYQFWMRGADQLSKNKNAIHRIVLMDDDSQLNRYWDENDTPRPEAFKEDVELSHESMQTSGDLFRSLRAAAESGWDFSSRWYKDDSFGSIHTTEIIPVDLNCLMLHLEETLAEAHQFSGNVAKSNHYLSLAKKRKSAIRKYCWNEESQFFFDYDFVSNKQKTQLTLAAAFPLFFEVATPTQALAVEKILINDFLKTGGMTTTLENSGQQWDAPNGWAPLQWICYKGLLNYGLETSANQLKSNWLNANLKVYNATGKMTEKYDVWNKDGEASGGEYPNQDGFGWTNGVFLAMSAV
jgi:alpha,alpha-trehalase